MKEDIVTLLSTLTTYTYVYLSPLRKRKFFAHITRIKKNIAESKMPSLKFLQFGSRWLYNTPPTPNVKPPSFANL